MVPEGDRRGSRFSPRSVEEQRLDNGLGPALLIREDLLDGLHQALAPPTQQFQKYARIRERKNSPCFANIAREVGLTDLEEYVSGVGLERDRFFEHVKLSPSRNRLGHIIRRVNVKG